MSIRGFLSIILQLLCKEIIRAQHISDRYMLTVSRRQNYSAFFAVLLQIYFKKRNRISNLLRENRIKLLIL